MICRFCSFVTGIATDFLSKTYDKIHVVFAVQLNLFQYQVYFVRL